MTHHCLRRLRRAVRRWLGCPEWRVSVASPYFEFHNILIDEESHMQTVLHDNDPGVMIVLSPKADSKGKTPQAGAIDWTCSNPSVLTIKPSRDSLSCEVTLSQLGQLGWATVKATDTSHPNLPIKEFTFRVDPQELTDYDATITPLPPSTDPAEPKATDEHQVVS